MKGILYGIGVGPGDPENLTLKAVNRIKNCEILLLPNEKKEDSYAYKIVKKAVPDLEEKKILCKDFPMIIDENKLLEIHTQIADEIIKYLEEGQSIAFLTIGDPCIYSTYSYIHELVLQRGGRAEMINGIPSFCAVAAKLGISLAQTNEEIHIIPGSAQNTVLQPGTSIFMKYGKQLTTLLEQLDMERKTKQLEIYGISNCGLEDEIIYKNLDEMLQVHKMGYLTVIIVKYKI